MKGSLIIVGFFILGIIAGMTGLLHIDDFGFDVSFTALAMLMFCVGIGVGSDFSLEKSAHPKRCDVAASVDNNHRNLGGCSAISLLFPDRSVSDMLAVGSGFDIILCQAYSLQNTGVRNSEP